LDESGLDLSLVHQLGDLLDIELFSLSVDNGLDFFLLYGVDVFVDDDILLDDLDLGRCGDDGGISNTSVRCKISGVDLSVVVSV